MLFAIQYYQIASSSQVFTNYVRNFFTLRFYVSGYELLCVLYQDMTLHGDKIMIRLLLTPISNVALLRRWGA